MHDDDNFDKRPPMLTNPSPNWKRQAPLPSTAIEGKKIGNVRLDCQRRLSTARNGQNDQINPFWSGSNPGAPGSAGKPQMLIKPMFCLTFLSVWNRENPGAPGSVLEWWFWNIATDGVLQPLNSEWVFQLIIRDRWTSKLKMHVPNSTSRIDGSWSQQNPSSGLLSSKNAGRTYRSHS